MTDKGYVGIQIPNLEGAVARPADPGFARLFFYEDKLYCRLSDGEVQELAKGKKKDLDKLIDDPADQGD